jgi:hypothetical protein
MKAITPSQRIAGPDEAGPCSLPAFLCACSFASDLCLRHDVGVFLAAAFAAAFGDVLADDELKATGTR